MADIQALIDRLDKVRETGRDRYIAKCPAHDDGDPSLSIRQLPDSRILLKCFAGCGAVDILNSLGLNWQSLMPDDGLYEPIAESRERAARSDLMVEYLEVVRQQGGRLSEDDKALIIKRKLGL
jgi:hypothetical protein